MNPALLLLIVAFILVILDLIEKLSKGNIALLIVIVYLLWSGVIAR